MGGENGNGKTGHGISSGCSGVTQQLPITVVTVCRPLVPVATVH